MLDLIPHVYDTERLIAVASEDGEQKQVMINQTVIDPTSPDLGATLNDVTIGAYDIVSIMGPSYASKRAQAKDSMIEFGRTMPQQAQLFADLIAKAQDWPGADEIAKRLRRTIPPHLLEDGQTGPPPPPPEVQIEQAKRETRAFELELDKQKAVLDLEARRKRLLLDVEGHMARIAALAQQRAAEGKDTREQVAVLDTLTKIQSENALPIDEIPGMETIAPRPGQPQGPVRPA